MKKATAIILASGKGTRFGSETPKQFLKLAGKMVIEHTVEVFQRSNDIDRILIVSTPERVDEIWRLSRKNNWDKLTKVVAGGKERFHSTYSSLLAMEGADSSTKILIHDSVRPLLTSSAINRCVQALDTFDAVDVVIPSTDTMVSVSDDGCIAEIPRREIMKRGQTPQGFKLGRLREAYDRANRSGRIDFTCDCGVVRAMSPEIRVATVLGSESNIKITTPLDLFLAEKLIQSTTVAKSLNQHDSKRFQGKNYVVFGGTSGIGKAIGQKLAALGANFFPASRTLNEIDIGNLDSVERFLRDVSKQTNGIDGVVNSAGILLRKPLLSMSQQEIHATTNVNYLGSVNVAMAAHKYLVQKQGVLVNFTSSSYTRGRANYALYSSTKCAIVNLTQALAEEWHDDGVRVHCINPERTQTPMRIRNFGLEPENTLLDPATVADTTLAALLSNSTGMIIDVKLESSALNTKIRSMLA